MVVLAASVLTKGGKPLVSRQYLDMTRIRIEGLLAAFPKLVGTGKQHTYVETENVRYVYQPMEGLFIVLVTNKQSNILEDLETLRMVSKLVPEFCQSTDEEDVTASAFDLIFAFDEVISLGHKENVTILQVKQNCAMESHEEKLHKMIIQSKINDTKDLMRKKASEIDKIKMESKKAGVAGGFIPSIPFDKAIGMLDHVDTAPVITPDAPVISRPAASTHKGPSKGMQLGKAKKTNNFLENLAKEGEAVELDVVKTSGPSSAPAAAAKVATEPASIDIEEKLSVQVNKEGGLENLEVQGTMSLIVNNDEDAFLRVAVAAGANKGFQFKTHPNIDKAAYTSKNMLCLKDPSRPFPTGSELGILKWRLQSKDENMVPLTISCWPSVSGGESYVNIEYECTASFDLQNVLISIPVPHGAPPAVNQIDGDWKYDSRQGVLLWSIELIDDTNRNGSLEFVVGAADSDAFFPIEVAFACNHTFCDIAVDTVTHTQREEPVAYSSKRQLVTSEYIVS